MTLTVGGAISGYCAIGRIFSETAPAIRMMMESTPANTGRSMKKRENTAAILQRAGVEAGADAGVAPDAAGAAAPPPPAGGALAPPAGADAACGATGAPGRSFSRLS